MTVGTGAASKTWHLPKELLVKTSAFFDTALNGGFAEATSKTITLPEESPDAFALFVQWLYVGEFISCTSVWSESEETMLNENLVITEGFLQACSLGDKLDCPVFLDLAVLELIKRHSIEGMRVETILFVYEHFGPWSKLRLFAIDQFRQDLQQKSLEDDAASFVSAARSAEDFGLDFLKASLEVDGADVINPQENTKRYMEVLTGTDED